MPNFHLPVALLMTMALLTPPVKAVSAEEVLYCVDLDSTGFKYSPERHAYEHVLFNEQKLTVKFSDRDRRVLVGSSSNPGKQQTYTCSKPYYPSDGMIMCVERFSMLNFSADKSRFIHGTLFGDLDSQAHDDGGDTITVSRGTCTKF